MRKLTIALLLLFSFITFSQSNHKQVRIQLKDINSMNEMIKAGIDIDHPFFESSKSIIVFLTFEDFETLKSLGYEYDIIIDDWKQHYASKERISESEWNSQLEQSETLNGVRSFELGSMGGYLTTDEIYAVLDDMRANYPNLITEKFSIGNTLEGNPQYVVKISDNPEIDEDEPEVFINSLIHCREPAAMMAIIYYMYYLLENYNSDLEVTHLVNNREIYFLPLVNVDGYNYNIQNDPNGGGMWRKNRRNNGGSYGVDLNRNFGYEWGYDNSGSSGDPSDETYRGTAPFSEPATANFRDFVENRNFVTCFNYHTYSNLYLYPWGYINEACEHDHIFKAYAAEISKYNNYTSGRPGQILYDVNGATDDWMYGETTTKNRIYSITPEVGTGWDGFWPDQNRILPLAMENLHPNLFLTWAAGGYVELVTAEYSPEYVDPGQSIELLPYIKNIGMETAENVYINVSTDSPYLTIPNGEMQLASIDSWTSYQSPTGVTVQVSESAPIGVKIPIYVETYLGDVRMDSDTVLFTPGSPNFMFNDQNDDPSVLFNLSSASGQSNWSATTSSFVSPDYSYTESPDGNYGDYADTKMITKDEISLVGVSGPMLVFWSKWEIEDNWDCGQVYISTNNGSSWTPLEGLYTVPGSGNGQQETGEPVYEKSQPTWVEEQIDLSDYVGESIKLKFEFRSDSYINKDGWYVDDIRIFYYGNGGTETICRNIDFSTGWNLVSVPVRASNMALTSILPDAAGQAYMFNDGYENASTMVNDMGYWVKFDAPGSSEVCGARLDNQVAVTAGWNIIGVNDSMHTVSAITTEPAGILNTDFFAFNNGYSVPSELGYGNAYWVKATQAGTINLNGLTDNKQSAEQLSGVELTVSDKQNTGKLYLLDFESDRSFEMPPKAPAGSFDVRFESNTYAEKLSGSHTVMVNSANEKLVISASEAVKISYISTTGIKEVTLDANETVTIAKPADGRLNISSVELPSSFALDQNYPNPFNPSTTIRFALPVDAKVQVTLYNSLGEKVAELVNADLAAGYQTVNFNASDLASGMYIYQISAIGVDGKNFSDTKKMMLMK